MHRHVINEGAGEAGINHCNSTCYVYCHPFSLISKKKIDTHFPNPKPRAFGETSGPHALEPTSHRLKSRPRPLSHFCVLSQKKEFEAQQGASSCLLAPYMSRGLRHKEGVLLNPLHRLPNPSHLADHFRTHPPHRLRLFASSPPRREARVPAPRLLPPSAMAFSQRCTLTQFASDHLDVILIQFSFGLVALC